MLIVVIVHYLKGFFYVENATVFSYGKRSFWFDDFLCLYHRERSSEESRVGLLYKHERCKMPRATSERVAEERTVKDPVRTQQSQRLLHGGCDLRLQPCSQCADSLEAGF